MLSANNPPRAIIFGCSGPVLTPEEARFFQAQAPLGFILFARNIRTPEQVRTLVRDLRAAVGRQDAPVLIDQEGGRVQRLRPPYWPQRPPMALFGQLAGQQGLDCAAEAATLNARLMAADLADLGIDVDCAPVIDVPVPGAHDVIGDRAPGTDPGLVIRLGQAVCDGLLAGGVLPVIKHIPGHGRAWVDSHHALPVVTTDARTLQQTDFAPFAALAGAPWAMTAHVIYTAFDSDRPATISPVVIDRVIRDMIGFDGVLLSDDLSMKALAGPLDQRTRDCLAAGCDVALHCNGVLTEMEQVAAGAPLLTDRALERLQRASAQKAAQPLPASAADRLAELLAMLRTQDTAPLRDPTAA